MDELTSPLPCLALLSKVFPSSVSFYLVHGFGDTLKRKASKPRTWWSPAAYHKKIHLEAELPFYLAKAGEKSNNCVFFKCFGNRMVTGVLGVFGETWSWQQMAGLQAWCPSTLDNSSVQHGARWSRRAFLIIPWYQRALVPLAEGKKSPEWL